MISNLLPKHWLMISLAAIFVVYVLFQARFIILGPQITIESHKDGTVSSMQAINLSGEAKNVAWITLNDRQIFIDEDGHWEEPLLLQEGTSIMSVNARDRFGRETNKSVRIIYN